MRGFVLKFAAVFWVIASFNVKAFAASVLYIVTEDYPNNKITVEGTVTDANYVVLQVLNKDFTYEDVKKDRTNSKFILYREQIAVTDGKFLFEIEYPFDTNAGFYNARIVTDGIEEKTDFSLRIISKAEYAKAVSKLNELSIAGDYEAFLKYVSDNTLTLGFDTELLNKLSGDNVLKPFMDYIKEFKLKEDKNTENTKIFNSFVLMKALEEGGISNIDNYIASTSLANTDVYEDYKSSVFKEYEKEYLTKKIIGISPKTLGEFETAFKQALVLEEIYYASGSGDVMEMLQKYGVTFKITSAASSDVYKALCGNDYTPKTLLEAYEKLTGENKEKPSSGGSSGSGIGGGGFSSSMMNAVYPENTNENVTKSSVYFNDIDSVKWATEAILALADKKIINGKSEGYFVPEDYVKREEFVKILLLAMGISENEYKENVFSDVSESDWYVKYVNIAKEKGIVNGVTQEKFGSGENITRQDMCVMLCNALKYKNVSLASTQLSFDDADKISAYAYDAVCALYNLGAVNGVSDSVFEPKGTATRAQAAKIVYGVLSELSK